MAGERGGHVGVPELGGGAVGLLAYEGRPHHAVCVVFRSGAPAPTRAATERCAAGSGQRPPGFLAGGTVRIGVRTGRAGLGIRQGLLALGEANRTAGPGPT